MLALSSSWWSLTPSGRSFSLYYIVSELWGSAGIPLLFWTCANDVTPIDQAKRLYSLFGLLGNLAPIASGQTMVMVRGWLKDKKGISGDAAFESSMKVSCKPFFCLHACGHLTYTFLHVP
jgi:ATP/ADP translocase